MFKTIKNKIVHTIVSQKLKHLRMGRQSFRNLYSDTPQFLVLMPENESHFYYALNVLKTLIDEGKMITLLTHDYRVNTLPQKFRQGIIDYGIADISKLNLPNKKFEQRLKEQQFSAVLDLSKEEDLFNSLAANLVQSQVRIGFKKKNSDMYYNLQVANSENNPEIFYKNFLNCLQMF
jgi:hypothetical protein